jgi:CheY-like chemotaxis protein
MSTAIHIIDPSKPSLVMTSEVFKDKVPGAIVTHSATAKEGIAYLSLKKDGEAPDLVVVDFDLPDADGVSLVRELRKSFKGPIFLTAFANDVVKHAVAEELFHYNDSCQWISKPVRSDTLDKKIEMFLFNRYRLGRRFDVLFPTLIVGKGAGRGKRSPKFDGRTTNISMGGLGVDLATPVDLKIGDEVVVSMAVPQGILEGTGPLDNLKAMISAARSAEAKAMKEKNKPENAVPAKQQSAPKKSEVAQRKGAKRSNVVTAVPEPTPQIPLYATKFGEYKIKATVAWLANGGKKAGISFARISDQQRRQIESFLKSLAS